MAHVRLELYFSTLGALIILEISKMHNDHEMPISVESNVQGDLYFSRTCDFSERHCLFLTIAEAVECAMLKSATKRKFPHISYDLRSRSKNRSEAREILQNCCAKLQFCRKS